MNLSIYSRTENDVYCPCQRARALILTTLFLFALSIFVSSFICSDKSVCPLPDQSFYYVQRRCIGIFAFFGNHDIYRAVDFILFRSLLLIQVSLFGQ